MIRSRVMASHLRIIRLFGDVQGIGSTQFSNQ